MPSVSWGVQAEVENLWGHVFLFGGAFGPAKTGACLSFVRVLVPSFF